MTSYTARRREPLNLGKTIPLVLVVTFSAELAMRAVRIDHFALRSPEAMRSSVAGAGPFVPGRRFQKNRTYGDLAALANLRLQRQYRREIFTSDEWGYRNAPSSDPARPPLAILVGDSFGVGAGTEDSGTLTAHLERLWGGRVYNASGLSPLVDLKQIRRLANRLGMHGGLVLYEYLERLDPPVVPRARVRRANSAAAREALPGFGEAMTEVRGWWDLSRSKILAERAYRFVQDGRILPNPYARNASVRRLSNGREMLFLPLELELFSVRRPVTADYWKWLEKELARDGLGLLVLLVPNKYTVYAPLLADAAGDAEGSDYLDRLEGALRAEGIPVVNLKGPFRARAAQNLAGDSYLYWLDDTHWNGRGMDVAAMEVAGAINIPSISPGAGRR